ncbi:hypothetical protein LG634_24655 [Streptomyces bambusae]|uniref:hypothetical protein n=1 Tax=Streptomyces bambusae TaxID=1550616 RepID=UPI001CFD1269|nr:hypothetical protein [Streptomyces bambusae]MCB5168005.1 hypothetical protein [Streptomyces bambusae]
MVEIQFTGQSPVTGQATYTYKDDGSSEYRYAINDNGTLAIFEKEKGGNLGRTDVPVAVYGAAAWFSVSGDPRTSADGSNKTMGF